MSEQDLIQVSRGLIDAFNILQDIEGVGFISLSQNAIMRHPVIQEIEDRYLNRV